MHTIYMGHMMFIHFNLKGRSFYGVSFIKLLPITTEGKRSTVLFTATTLKFVQKELNIDRRYMIYTGFF